MDEMSDVLSDGQMEKKINLTVLVQTVKGLEGLNRIDDTMEKKKHLYSSCKFDDIIK
jgi:hypothetical protein